MPTPTTLPAVTRRAEIERTATARTVTLPDGRRLSFEYWPGVGAPLVLLHGLLDCGLGWKHVAEAMDCPCYALDLPGFGDSDCPTRNRISAYAEDVCDALAALDVHRFTLVGHSLGGAVATGVVELLGDDVTALVLMAPVGFGRIHVAEAMQLPVVRRVVRHGLPLALSNPVSAIGVYMAVVGNGHLPDRVLLGRLRKNAYRWAPGAACANEAITAAGFADRAFHRRRIDYDKPVLALWGGHDRLVSPAHRDGVLTAFPHAQIRVWEKIGHHPQRECPSELARVIRTACTGSAPRALGRPSRRTPRPSLVPAGPRQAVI